MNNGSMFQSVPICSPDTVLLPPPFRSSIQYLYRWIEAPERGLVNALDRSISVDHSLCTLSLGYSNALKTSIYRPPPLIKLAEHN